MGKIFVKGLLFFAPIVLTVAILAWVFRTAESIFRGPLKLLVPDVLHFPGMGVLVTVCVIYLLGLAINGRVLNVVFSWTESILKKVPLVNVVYRNVKEMIDFISGSNEGDMERVVLATLTDGVKLIGFVTNPDARLPTEQAQDLTAVYFPMSYQMGGYVLYLPESKLETLNMTTQEAMQRVLTAEISKPDAKKS